jgi:hypothetical protein
MDGTSLRDICRLRGEASAADGGFRLRIREAGRDHTNLDGPGDTLSLVFPAPAPEPGLARSLFLVARGRTSASEDDVSRGGHSSAPRLVLGPVRPNPFRGATALHFSLSAPASVCLEVFDLQGRRVKVLARGPHGAGEHEARWDGRDEEGRELPQGLYLYRLEAGTHRGGGASWCALRIERRPGAG